MDVGGRPSHAAMAIVVWLASVGWPAGVRAADEPLLSGSRLDRWMEAHPEWLLGREGCEGLDTNEVLRLGVTYAVMGSSLAIVELAAQPPRDARWEGDNGFDDAIRDVLKGDSRSTRSSAASASDVLLGGLGLFLFLDRLWLRNEVPALKGLLFDGSWLLTNELVTQSTKVAAGRERPYADPCDGDSDYVSDCDEGRDRNASFFSGHASTTASIAGLVCSRHLRRVSPGWRDWLVCSGAVAASATTGVLRLTAEQHHATDVLAGWASGVLFGYVLPSRFDPRPQGNETVRSLVPLEPIATPQLLGFRVRYSF